MSRALTGHWRRWQDWISRLRQRYPRFDRVLVNFGWLFVDRVIRLGLGLVIGVWVARYLGPEQLGQLNFVLAFAGFIGMLALLGLESIVQRELVRRPEAAGVIVGSALGLKLAAGVLVQLIGWAALSMFAAGQTAVTGLAALLSLTALFQAADVIDYWFQSQVRAGPVVWVRLGVYATMALVRGGLVIAQAPLAAFVVLTLVEAAVTAFGLIVLWRWPGASRPRLRIDRAVMADLVRASWPLALSGLSVWLYLRVDQLMLGTMGSHRELGVYAIAVRLAEIWNFVPVIIVSSLFPGIVALRDLDPRAYADRLQKIHTGLVALAYAAMLFFGLAGQWVIAWLYGPAYSEAWPMLLFLAAAGVFVALGVVREAWVVAEGLSMFSFATTALGAAVNIALNLAWIPTYGGLGAAWATLIAQVVAVSLATILYPKTRMMVAMQLRALALWGRTRS
jgi:PST family polysaccharide transporter